MALIALTGLDFESRFRHTWLMLQMRNIVS